MSQQHLKIYRMKKAQIEVSFNWIFVLIAGFALLIFFYMIINNTTSSSQEQLSRTITQRMGGIFESIQAAPNTAERHNRVSFELDFSCIGGVHEFRRGGSSSSAYLDQAIIFTPSRLGDSPLLTHTQRIQLPFLVAPILHMSDERTLYKFSPEASTFANLLDNIFIKETLTPEFETDTEEELHNPNFRKTVFITTTPLTEISPSRFLDIIYINASSNEITINNNPPLKYFSNEMLTGAIISANYEITKCNFDKINQSFERTKNITITRKNKILQQLNSQTNPNSNCITLLEQTNINHNFTQQFNAFRDSLNALETINRDLERLSCPTIY